MDDHFEHEKVFTREPLDLNPENTSGWWPVIDKILVRVRKIKDKTAGGIQIPKDILDKEENFDNLGVVVAMGNHTYKGIEPECQVGDFVLMDKFVGEIIPGKDGNRYRLISDRMILANERHVLLETKK